MGSEKNGFKDTHFQQLSGETKRVGRLIVETHLLISDAVIIP